MNCIHRKVKSGSYYILKLEYHIRRTKCVRFIFMHLAFRDRDHLALTSRAAARF